MISRAEIEQIFNPATFSPVVITTKSGFAVPVQTSRNVLIGLRMLIVKGPNEPRLYQIPFHAIDHIDETGESLN